MKILRKIILLIFCIGILFGATSCAVFLTKDSSHIHKDNGKHEGWFKNKNNSHNPSHNQHEKDNKKTK
jgi:hypothetical protein